jgi:hypothetical protein
MLEHAHTRDSKTASFVCLNIINQVSSITNLINICLFAVV